MKWYTLLVAAAFLCSPAHAQVKNQWNDVAVEFDLDGAQLDADLIVTVVDLTNIALTIAAQPDICRRISITIVDTTPSITAGTTTIVGTDCDGDALTEAIDGSSGAGTYISTGLFESVVSATNAAYATLGGSSDETITVGTAALTVDSTYYCTYRGISLQSIGSPYPVPYKIETSGSSTTVTAVTSTQSPFANLAAGDLIHVYTTAGGYQRRLVTAVASNISMTVDTAINLDVGGITFRYHKQDCGAGDRDGWLPLKGMGEGTFQIQFSQMTVNAGINYNVECKVDGYLAEEVIIIGPTNVTAALDVTGNVFTEHWDLCRAGFIMASDASTYDYDDASDAGTEKIHVYISGGTE